MPSSAPAVASKHKPAAAKTRPAVGWREWVALPDLGIDRIKAKVDTGARTSAIHAFNIRPFHRNGEYWIRFDVNPLQRDNDTVRQCTARVVDYRWVTNSGGGRQKRFVIETTIGLGEHRWPVEMTLTDRDQMGFRMLLGRSAVKGRFVVDPGRSYCQSRRKRRAKKKRRRGRTAATDNEEE